MSITLALILALCLGDTAPPTYFVERVLRVGDEVRRVSIFRDGNAVLAWSKPGQDKIVLKRTMTDAELEVIAQVVGESALELRSGAAVGQEVGEASIEVRLAPRGGEPLVVRYPLAAVPMRWASRLGKMLDEIETTLLTSKPGAEDLREWTPTVGEWVELQDGRVCLIAETHDGGGSTIYRVQVGDGPVSVYMVLDELRQQAVRRVRR